MYIRQTKIKNSKQGVPYCTYRLVESVRVGEKVKQLTLLNLGKNFNIDREHWPALTARIVQLLQAPDGQQADLFDLKQSLDESLEMAAQRYTALILHKQSKPLTSDTANTALEAPDYQMVDINHLKALKPRSIGAETLALHAFTQLQLDKKLTALGFNGRDLAAVTGNIIGRMVSPGSERHTLDWLQTHSALGELLDHDFETTSLTRLYTVTDKLLAHQDKIEQFLYQRECDLFDLKQTIVLYDLTNTFFEGTAKLNPKAQYGRSKEKRTDCPLVTMGLVLDGDGFPINSKIFEGNISEAGTLEQMIEHLGGMSLAESPTIAMDAGIASEENIQWLKSNGFHYIVVSRKRHKERPDEAQGAVVIKDEIDNKVIAQRVDDPDNGEVLLYCHSERREKKDQGIRNRFHQRFEVELEKVQQGLSKKGCTKAYEKVVEKIGRLKGKNNRVAQEYQIDITPDDDKKKRLPSLRSGLKNPARKTSCLAFTA
jgi:transposase